MTSKHEGEKGSKREATKGIETTSFREGGERTGTTIRGASTTPAITMTKENNGRGARRKLFRRIGLIVSVVGAVAAASICASRFLIRAPDADDADLDVDERDSQGYLSRGLNAGGGGGVGGGRRRDRSRRRNRRNEEELSHEEVMDRIVRGEFHLVEVSVRNDEMKKATTKAAGSSGAEYDGVYGEFCKLEFSLHKRDPSSTPMFHDLVSKSPSCAERTYTVNLREAVRAVNKYDEGNDGGDKVKVNRLRMGGLVFHESRCGSTLVSNLLMSSNPEQHRVYSESSPPISTVRNICGSYVDVDENEHEHDGNNHNDCADTAAAALRDVFILMNRSNDAKEKKVFYKIQSIGTRHISIFLRGAALASNGGTTSTSPDPPPYLFVYRDPVQVMMSQLARGTRKANCVRPMNSSRQPEIVLRALEKHGYRADRATREITPEQYCALHLSTITEAAERQLTRERREPRDDGGGRSRERHPNGIPINYSSLPDILYGDVFPRHFGLDITAEALERMKSTASMYSKGRGNKAGEFRQDSEQKERKATEPIKSASTQFLSKSYDELESMSHEYLLSIQTETD